MLWVPGQLREISSEWLAHVLDAPVAAVQLTEAHAGTTGRGVLEVEYARACDLPRRLFVKLPPSDEMQRAFVCSSGMGRREALFYQSLSREVPLRVPRCFHAATNDSGDEYIMLLEHLEDSECTFHNASARYSLHYIRQVLAAFARLHAAYWESPRFDRDLAWVEPPLQHDIAVQLVARALTLHGAAMPAVFRDMGELYLEHTEGIHRLWQEGAATLVHGDVHNANLFYDGDKPGFLDWALLARAPAMRDVGYFLAGTLTAEHQRTRQRDLLAYYRKKLLAHGAPAPAMADLWQQYQWHAAYVWVGAAVTLAMGDAWQPVNYVLRSLERLHGALEVLDSVAVIRGQLIRGQFT